MTDDDWINEIVSGFMHKHRRKAKDYHGRFTMNGQLRNHAYNLRANGVQLSVQQALADEYDVTRFLWDEIEQRAVQENQNISVKIEGPKGEGKSELAMALAVRWREAYLAKVGEEVTEEAVTRGILYAFSDGEMANMLQRLEPGFVTLQDERPHGEGAEKINTMHNVENVDSQDRAMQVAHIYCDPKSMNLQTVDFAFEPWGKDRATRTSRFLVRDQHGNLVGHVIVPLHTYEAFRAEYARRKEENIEKVWAARGKVTAQAITSADEETIAALVEWAGTVAGKVKVTKTILIAKIAEMGVAGSIRKHGILATQAQLRFLLSQATPEGGKAGSADAAAAALVPAESWPDFYEANAPLGPSGEQGRAIVAEYLRGLSERQIMAELRVTRHAVQVAKKEAREGQNDAGRIGYVFEWFVAILLGVPPEQARELCASDENTPDIAWGGMYYSVKWRDNADPKIKWSLSKDCAPELAAAQAEGKAVIFIETNRAWGAGIRRVELRPGEDPDEFHTHKDMVPWANANTDGSE